jgi:hypothetical protein
MLSMRTSGYDCRDDFDGRKLIKKKYIYAIIYKQMITKEAENE